jgi:Domain of unknown function (DUF4350)
MSDTTIFSRKLLIGWIAAAVVIFAASLFLMGTKEHTGPDPTGASTFSRSAIGHAGIVEVLHRLDVPVVKSTSHSLDQLAGGGVLVLAEPRASAQSEEALRTLLKADTVLLVLPKWFGLPSQQHPGWLGQVRQRLILEAEWAVKLVDRRAEVVREDAPVTWTTNVFGLAPNVVKPLQLIRGTRLRPLLAGEGGMLVAELVERNRRTVILSDPDVIANHGLAREGNAALAVALINRLRGREGAVVFDETIHGYTAPAANPFLLLFRFPFVAATLQGLVAIGLLLWATLARFGAPQSLPPPLSAGRAGLLQNMAKLIEFTGHQHVMIRRYVEETVRHVARQLHAPRALTGEALLAWLQRVGGARGVTVDCMALLRRARSLREGSRRDQAALVSIARDTHRWQGEMLDGRARYPRDH